MAEPALQRQDHHVPQSDLQTIPDTTTDGILVYVDSPTSSQKIVPHARAIAKAFKSHLTLVEAVTSGNLRGGPVDPIGWGIRLREAQSRISSLAQECVNQEGIATEILVGEPADRLSQRVRDGAISFTALCTHGIGDPSKWDIGNTARRIIETVPGSMLLIPATIPDHPVVDYRRILVPLDGSRRAESALPVAINMARAHGAELLLVHAISEPEITETKPLNAEGVRLFSNLSNHSERTSRDYLDTVRRRIVNYDLSVRIKVLQGGDARRQLVQVITDENIDLMIIAAHGYRGHKDVPFGDVAAHLIARSSVPLLMIRNRLGHPFDNKLPSTENRLPGQLV